MNSGYADLSRPPLHSDTLRSALVHPGGLWTSVQVVAETGSTNADLARAAREGTPEGAVLVAEHQQAGRGRLDRGWSSPPRAGLTVSMLLRPSAPQARWGWLPLLTGVALVDVIRRLDAVPAGLKWPNDLLIGERSGTGVYQKCAGILAEVVEGAVVIGVGLNVSLRRDELPRADTTSLLLAGGVCTDRDPLLRAFLREFADLYRVWLSVDGDPATSGLRDAYLDSCLTVHERVRVSLPRGDDIVGTATGVDVDGRLVVRTDGDAEVAVAAGDVRHVR